MTAPSCATFIEWVRVVRGRVEGTERTFKAVEYSLNQLTRGLEVNQSQTNLSQNQPIVREIAREVIAILLSASYGLAGATALQFTISGRCRGVWFPVIVHLRLLPDVAGAKDGRYVRNLG